PTPSAWGSISAGRRTSAHSNGRAARTIVSSRAVSSPSATTSCATPTPGSRNRGRSAFSPDFGAAPGLCSRRAINYEDSGTTTPTISCFRIGEWARFLPVTDCPMPVVKRFAFMLTGVMTTNLFAVEVIDTFETDNPNQWGWTNITGSFYTLQPTGGNPDGW